MTFLFVGEKPSWKAYDGGLTWRDGKLAAKTLFDALRAIEVEPERQNFFNLFGDEPSSLETDNPEIKKRVRKISNLAKTHKIVALGGKVSKLLEQYGVTHKKLVHPAARGKIRGKEVYIAHVREVLIRT